MKKLVLILWAAVWMLLPAQARMVRGSVCGPDSPLAGVIVSDGYRFTTTGKDGTFRFDTHKDARFVFVITPSGYTADYADGSVRFHQPVKDAKRFDFKLSKNIGGGGYLYTLLRF